MSCCNKEQYDDTKDTNANMKLTLHKKKSEKMTKEKYTPQSNYYHGEERSVKDIQMLREFGCRKNL